VTGGWRKLHNEKAPYVIFFSSYYYDSEKEDHMDGLVARRNVKRYKTFVGMPEGKSILGRSSTDWRIILKWILRKKFWWCEFDSYAQNRDR
jgi:hypothetical protein